MDLPAEAGEAGRMKTKKHEKTNIRNYEIHEKTRKTDQDLQD